MDGVCFFLWLFIGLRDASVGPDTRSYIAVFRHVIGLDWNQFLFVLKDSVEPLYLLIMRGIGLLGDNYTVMLLAWAIPPVWCMYYTLSKEITSSSSVFIVILVFFLLGFFVFFTAGLRQAITIGLAFATYQLLISPMPKKWYKSRQTFIFLGIIYIGYNIHNSILIFFLMYFLKPVLQNFKIRWWYILLAIGFYFIGQMITMSQLQIITQFFFEDRYYQYGDYYTSSWSASAFIMQLILFSLCFFVKDKLVAQDKTNIFLMNMAMIGLFFQSMSGVLAEMSRVSYYFSIFYLILIPRAIETISDSNGKVVQYCFDALCLIYLFTLTSTNLPEYHFAIL